MNHISQDGERRENEGIEPWARKKKVKADVVSWSHLSRKVQPFFKSPRHRYPATCHWLTGADQSESYSCSFNLTWDIKKAEGTRDEYTRHQAVILGQNKAEKTQGSLQIIFTLATILGDLRWGPSTSLPLCRVVFHGVSFPYSRNRDELSVFELHKLLKFPFCSLFKLVIYLACRIILKPYVFKKRSLLLLEPNGHGFEFYCISLIHSSWWFHFFPVFLTSPASLPHFAPFAQTLLPASREDQWEFPHTPLPYQPTAVCTHTIYFPSCYCRLIVHIFI